MTREQVPDLGRVLRAGDHVFVGEGAAEPLALTEALVEQRHALGGVTVLLGYTTRETFRPEHTDALRVTMLGGYGANGALARARPDEVLPCQLSTLPGLIVCGSVPVDAVLVQCSPPDRHGRHSLGVTVAGLPAALSRARVVVAEVNDRMPFTYGHAMLPADRIDLAVHTSRPLPTRDPGEPKGVERAVARRVAELVPDGAVLQYGIGRVPDAVLAALRGHRDLGVHSGLVTDGVVDLVECGAVTNARKPVDRGVTVGGLLYGSERLYDWADRNDLLAARPLDDTHGAESLRRFADFVSVNSAVEVDLTGQVNAETVGDTYAGAVGGHVDYVRAGAAAERGTAIVALPAATRTRSRIVPRLDAGVVTTLRTDVDVVCTEYGVAHLAGRTLGERARRLIAIAHPDHRETLERHAREASG